MAAEKIRILFVCTGNTCRSPMAAALLRRECECRSRTCVLETASAGLAAIDGEKASEHARTVMRPIGIDLAAHTSQLLDGEMVVKASLILVMSRQQRKQLLHLFPAAAAKTFLLKEFAGTAGNPDVADPYGGSLEDYRQTCEEIYAAIKEIIEILERGMGHEGSFG